MPKILKVKDSADKFHKEMPLFDIPFKLLLNSKSQIGMGKTTIILNLLLSPHLGYADSFLGKNIFIVSNNKLDNKLKLLQDYKEIPDENIMEYDEQELTKLYADIEEKFIEEKEDKNIQNRIIIFDDVGYSGSLKNKNFGIITKLVANARHVNLSQIYTAQRFSMVSTNLRSNLTGACLGATSMKELELIENDFNYLNSKKEFIKMFREYTSEPRSFLCVNFTNKDGLYMDSEFNTIDTKDL